MIVDDYGIPLLDQVTELAVEAQRFADEAAYRARYLAELARDIAAGTYDPHAIVYCA